MERKDYKSLNDFRGNVLKKLIPLKDVKREPLGAVVSFVKETLCNACGACSRSCFYDAIKMEDESAKVSIDKCDGCGLCSEVCPENAIFMVSKS
jgi:dihydropyrimidine dehydrogenase (NAD+) subunit PreA